MRLDRRSPRGVIVLLSLWIASAGNLPLWLRLQELEAPHGAARGLLLLTLFLLLATGSAALLALFAWRGLLKPAACALLLAGALAGHFMLAYGVVMDPGMLTNALQTDPHEVRALLGGRMVLTLLVLAGLPAAWLLFQRVAYPPPGRQLAQNVLLFLLAGGLALAAAFGGFQPLAALMRGHKEVRYLANPHAALYSLGRALAGPERSAGPPAPGGTDAHLATAVAAGGRPAMLLLVVGETARADHFGINGYARDTTPRLAQAQVASFGNAWSCGTSTAASLPCMFSALGRERFTKAPAGAQEGLLDVLQRAGLAVLWIDNQAGCKGVCDRVPHASTSAAEDAQLCRDGECLDEIMLRGLDARIAALDPARVRQGLVVVLHQMGSHGPDYARRSPAGAKPFQPECTTPSLSDCSREAVVNAYDNSIAYTDRFLGEAIGWLQARSAGADTALLYVSDHGESLGENNLYLHGLPYLVAPAAQKHVPWVTWLSDGYQQHRGLSSACLRGIAGGPVSHDHYFHSVLGLMQVRTEVYDGALDAYAPCRAARTG